MIREIWPGSHNMNQVRGAFRSINGRHLLSFRCQLGCQLEPAIFESTCYIVSYVFSALVL